MGFIISKLWRAAVSRKDPAAAQQEALIDFYHNMKLTHYSVVDPRIGHDRSRMAWEAVLFVQARDLDRLLREGLRVSADDAVPQRGCAIPYPCPDSLSWHGWAHAQQYALRGAGAGGWSAHLVVGARKREVLARFRIEHVAGRMAQACAWNGEASLVFHHDAFDAVQKQYSHRFAVLVDESSPLGFTDLGGLVSSGGNSQNESESMPDSLKRSFMDGRTTRLKTIMSRRYRVV
ncbi:hypothetical protein CGRA01v4_14127 [Colletotrichum graminicola]|uniref:Uncharacterized protein n=1 Tax=Colletotrichum graminicola (strain M1.001 / M2 / FGSC 10212) TaxID=645133 RepID=E3QUY6_COLGM|nr:uncharacterized protein GLRG_09818 [Colletotrichum graminicola M1.001]EFQ34674.1 hypothetical protein GLRG_09818 [Colletotrichum graminicola M1.001]WDK22836.1 hypothetical protein CGRA01v4_14127 [Colletotrichum graminicola]